MVSGFPLTASPRSPWLTERVELVNAEVTTKLSRLPALPGRIRQAPLRENAAVGSNKSMTPLRRCSGEMPHVRSRHRSDRISVTRRADRGRNDWPCRRLSPLRPRSAHHKIGIPLPAFGTAQQPTKSQRESAVTEILAAVIAEIPKSGKGRSASAEQSRWRQHHRAKATPPLYPQQRQCRKPRPGSNPCTRF